MKTFYPPLLPGKVYHLFNHAVGSENLFRENANYSYFLEKYKKYAVPVCRTFSYALLPNHFHILMQVRTVAEIALQMPPCEQSASHEVYAGFVMQRFSNLFNAYAKAYNKRYGRRGALFIDFVRRKPVESADYFERVVLCHHFYAVYHGFCDTPLDYRFSSYPAFLSSRQSLLEREMVIGRFGGREAFIARHRGYEWRFDEELEF